MNKLQIGKQIYELRKKYKMTQSELAYKVGITNRAVSKWENGISAPSIDTLYKICNCFRISTDYFILDEQDNKIQQSGAMKSIKQLYKIGNGPSSLHTIGPERACRIFRKKNSDADKFKVVLYGALAHTGIVRGTHDIINKVFSPCEVKVEIDSLTNEIPYPDAMELFAYKNGNLADRRFAYSLGGGDISIDGIQLYENRRVYNFSSYRDIMEYCKKKDIRIWQYVEETEGKEIWDYLQQVWETMKESINRGLSAEGFLPGELGISRKARYS